MPTGTITKSITIGGVNFSGTITRTASGEESHQITLTAAKSGTITTRTDNDTGVLTLGSSHGITDSNVVNVAWSGGMRYNMSVTGYDATTITVDGGTGDNLPAQSTVVYAAVPQSIDASFDGDDLSMLVLLSTVRAHAWFQDSGDASLLAVELTANEPVEWLDSSGYTLPITGNPVTEIRVSNLTATAGTFKIGMILDSED